MPDIDVIGRDARSIAKQVTHWSPARWRVSAASGQGSRADAMAALVQTLADLCAAAEGRPPRQVPRLPHETALPDQLRVVAADLCEADPDPQTCERAAVAVKQAHRELFSAA